MAASAKRMANARKARSQIARTFASLTNEHTHITDVLASPPSCLGRIRIYDVLRRVPHLNRDGAEKVLRHSKVWPLTTIDNLTPEEKARIVQHLPPRVKFHQ